MAEIVVSAVVTVLIEKLLTSDLMNLARSEGLETQLKKLKKNFLLIEAVLADSAQKQNQKPVELWLIELQHLAYDIDDVLGDMATEVLRRKLNHQVSHDSTRTSCSKLSKFVPTCCTNNFNPRNFMYGRKISSKLDEVTTRLGELVDQKNTLGLDLNVKVEKSNKNRSDVRYHQTCSVNESKVLGREKDKEALIGQLLGNEEESSNQNVMSVLSVVGMGGLGKTTLAQILYNDQKVKDHFELMAWVCVSDEFDVFSISNALYEAVGGEDKQFVTLNSLHMALKENLSGKRFLIVLDDVWNEDPKKWDLFRSAFDVGAYGSKFLVTTRNKEVASVMDCVQPYMLEVLSDEIALSLFARFALNEQNFDKRPSLKSIAQGIVKKCDGLPLALVTLGKVLKRKGIDDEWEELLNSEIWNLEDESGILPALKLSYYDLPSHLKQVFAYCSLFPKDYEFKRKKLVLLWMAQGFLSQTRGKNQSMESLGDKYFEELLSRSFFQPLGQDDKSRYIMHDLMNDLATSVAREFVFRLDENMDLNNRNEAYEKFRHFSFIGQQRVAEYKKFNELHKARRLRSFLAVSVSWRDFKTLDDVTTELLPHLNFLRVLSLTNQSITEVPHSIGNLKHLRYLNFSKTNIEGIPEQVSELYNLQSLLVRKCHKLSSLPASFVKLINLRHLDMTYTPSLKKLPLGIGGLTSLQTLSKVIIERGKGFKISELKGLSNLQGEFSIECLEQVLDPTEAKDANLQQKKGLDDLDMRWSDAFDAFRNPAIEYDVFERLKAPSKLKILSISFYGGMKFPSWLGNPKSFDQLTKLKLRGCENCTDLPTLGHLSSLRKLCLSGMKVVRSVGIELLAHSKLFHGHAFPSLESLEVDDMQCLEIWSTSGGDDVETRQSFPRLHAISFNGCPKLGKVSFGLIPSLEILTVEGCPEAVLRGLVGGSSSIRTLKLDAIKGLTQLDREVLKHLGAVEDLTIDNCDELRYLWESELEASRYLGSLQELYVWKCPKLETINKGEKEVVHVGSLRKVSLWSCDALESYCCPNSVERLEIHGCDSITSLSFSKLQEEEDLPSSSNLKFLWISRCKKIKSISQEHLQSLTSLEEMRIYGCPSMEDSFPSCGLLWPPNLKCLRIGELKKPLSEWGLQNYPSSLVELMLYGEYSGVVSFGVKEQHHNNNNNNNKASSSCFLLPPSLTSLSIWEFERLEIHGCDSITSLSFPSSSNLKFLLIGNCKKIKSISQEHLQSLTSLESINKGEKEVGSSIIMGSLRKVSLWSCDALESYCCPNSVASLDIRDCNSMTSLSFSNLQQEEDLPSSSSNLKFLRIGNCKKIKSISMDVQAWRIHFHHVGCCGLLI